MPSCARQPRARRTAPTVSDWPRPTTLHLVDDFGAEALELRALERLDRKPSERPIDAQFGQPAHVGGGERLAGTQAESDFNRPRTLGRARVFAQMRNLGPRLVQAMRDPVPSVAQPGRALERGLAGAAKDDWRMRLLDGLGHKLHPLGRNRLTLVERIALAPQLDHQLQVLASAQCAVLELHPDRLELLLEPSDADAEDDAAVAQLVERGDRLGGGKRVAQRHHEDAGGEANLRG